MVNHNFPDGNSAYYVSRMTGREQTGILQIIIRARIWARLIIFGNLAINSNRAGPTAAARITTTNDIYGDTML